MESNELREIESVLDERYEILSRLGQGGMSTVYKAEHKTMNKVVAVKVLHAHLSSDPTSTKRFQQEARAISGLKHQNIVDIYSFGITASGQPYLVSEYIEGITLQQAIKQQGPFAVKEAVSVFIQICDGLEHAHKQGIVHRDIKPSNIMLSGTTADTTKATIVDFGTAKILQEDLATGQALTQTGQIFGSPPYMSPEQCRGASVDTRSDIYSLGCLMYETITGSVPFGGSSPLDTMSRHLVDRPEGFGLALAGSRFSIRLESVIRRCMAKHPDRRYQSVAELKEALKLIRSDSGPLKSALVTACARSLSTLSRLRQTQPAMILLSAIMGGLITALILWPFLGKHETVGIAEVPQRPELIAGVAPKTLLDQARILLAKGQIFDAKTLQEKALDIAQVRYGSSVEGGQFLMEASLVYIQEEFYPEARILLRRSREIFKDNKETAALMRADNYLGLAAMRLGDFQLARRSFEEELALRLGRGLDTSQDLYLLGVLDTMAGNDKSALQHLSAAAKGLTPYSDGYVDTILTLGFTLTRQNQPRQALAILDKLQTKGDDQKLRQRLARAEALVALGGAANLAAAKIIFLDILNKEDDNSMVGTRLPMLIDLAKIYMKENDPVQAQKTFDELFALKMPPINFRPLRQTTLVTETQALRVYREFLLSQHRQAEISAIDKKIERLQRRVREANAQTKPDPEYLSNWIVPEL